MSDQAPDYIENRNSEVEFGELSLYSIITGDIQAKRGWGDRYVFKTQPFLPVGSMSCSILWRGYIANFTLSSEGNLTLNGYSFPFAQKKFSQLVNESLTGNFWLVMKSAFFGDRVYVPFHAGIIDKNEANWILEGNNSLDTLKYPEREERFKPKNILLDQPVFVGIIERITFHEPFDEYPHVVLDRKIPQIHLWCEIQIRRDGKIITSTKILGSSGDEAGPWMLRPSMEPMVEIGDHVFAIEREPTDDEINEQMARKAT